MGSAIIQMILKSSGANESALLNMYGFIFAAVLGYMGDQLFGTDDGYSLWKKSASSGMKFTLGSLVTSKFMRYLITVFLDMFISGCIVDV